MKKTEKERFLAKVAIVPEHSCWEWTAGKLRHGYGGFRFKDRTTQAHRTSYQLFIGLVPTNLQVCHSCDNKSCVRPEHLFLDTAMGNTRDKMKKNRQYRPKGTRNPKTKLNESKILEIRKLRPYTSLKRISEIYKIGISTISKICNKHYWKHI